MSILSPRKDRETAAKVNEALVMQRALGDEAARRFLKLQGVNHKLAERVLTAPPEQRRYS
jgi:hypothetical protein